MRCAAGLNNNIAMNPSVVERIVSGGQTGVDRAALDFAIESGIAHGGWCPKGRLASDGPLDARYQLVETESAGYRQRTKLNVRDSDATLVINTGELGGGTLQTVLFARQARKPHLVIQLDELDVPTGAAQIVAWLSLECIKVLNIAGPREEKRAGIYAATVGLLRLAVDWRRPT
jgi:hypothetical protein